MKISKTRNRQVVTRLAKLIGINKDTKNLLRVATVSGAKRMVCDSRRSPTFYRILVPYVLRFWTIQLYKSIVSKDRPDFMYVIQMHISNITAPPISQTQIYDVLCAHLIDHKDSLTYDEFFKWFEISIREVLERRLMNRALFTIEDLIGNARQAINYILRITRPAPKIILHTTFGEYTYIPYDLNLYSTCTIQQVVSTKAPYYQTTN